MHTIKHSRLLGALLLSVLLVSATSAWALTKRDLRRQDSRSAVTVSVTYLNPLGKVQGNTLDFEVRLETHSVDLDGFKVEELAVHEGSSGVKAKALGWFEPGGGGHHRFGILRFPKNDKKGNPLLSLEEQKLELRIRGIAEAAERVFKWDISH
ncbi:MAG: hypothetical protein HOG04_15490 [Nitrospinaceae bacterium]|nr:hypothetical protein [Nitrospinaceae bacterium]